MLSGAASTFDIAFRSQKGKIVLQRKLCDVVYRGEWGNAPNKQKDKLISSRGSSYLMIIDTVIPTCGGATSYLLLAILHLPYCQPERLCSSLSRRTSRRICSRRSAARTQMKGCGYFRGTVHLMGGENQIVPYFVTKDPCCFPSSCAQLHCYTQARYSVRLQAARIPKPVKRDNAARGPASIVEWVFSHS